MGETIGNDALEIGEDRLHHLAGLRRGIGDLPDDVTRLGLRADRALT